MKKRTALRAALLVLLIPLLLIASYAFYVFTAWGRLGDNLPLEAVPGAAAVNGDVETGRTYRLVSYNVGFGAYSADYSAFMDGGKESRARSAQAAEENLAGAMGELQILNGDFVLLQEVDVDGTRSRHVDELALTRRLAGEAYCSVFAQNYDSPYLLWPLTAPHGANRSGQVTFSLYQLTSARRRSLPVEEGVARAADLDRCYSVSRVPVLSGDEDPVLGRGSWCSTTSTSPPTPPMEPSPRNS